ncbi:dihydroorotate oxidase [Candidatus Gracilibacteria bacterium]|nr:dihydroorotate oxidase [Candidatus Gracilibacteria bacterium]NUJ99277.1 dihydroorotate oxidase [Candidatus Gracilibacteria bacterium]
MTNMETQIGNIKFSHPIFNASGPACTTLEELEIIGKSESSAIMMKTCSLEPREGNPEPRYKEVPLGSINSMGLPNLGYKKYVEFSHILKEKYKKPVIASVVGFCSTQACNNDFEIIVKAFQEDSLVDLIEVNLSCPNVVGKPQIAYDFETSDTILSLVENLGNKDIGIKLPPYFDPSHTNAMSEVIKKHPQVKFITCINSVGNTLIIDPETEQPIIKPKGGFGGLGGEYVKPIALANVRAFYKNLGESVKIIGAGGILNGIDVYEFLLAGASAVQLGTTFAKEGPEAFARIKKEFENYLEKKGKKSLDEVIGKLKEL